MSKHDRNTQIEQDRQNVESADLQNNAPEANRPSAANEQEEPKGTGRRRVVKGNAPAQTGGGTPGVDDLVPQDKPLK